MQFDALTSPMIQQAIVPKPDISIFVEHMRDLAALPQLRGPKQRRRPEWPWTHNMGNVKQKNVDFQRWIPGCMQVVLWIGSARQGAGARAKFEQRAQAAVAEWSQAGARSCGKGKEQKGGRSGGKPGKSCKGGKGGTGGKGGKKGHGGKHGEKGKPNVPPPPPPAPRR